jgi:hypothetical protein
VLVRCLSAKERRVGSRVGEGGIRLLCGSFHYRIDAVAQSGNVWALKSKFFFFKNNNKQIIKN